MLQAIIFDYDGTISKTMERQYKWFQYWWNHEINKEKVKGRDFPYKNFKSFMEMFNEKINHVDWVQNVYNFLGLSSDLKDLNHPVWVNYRNFCLEHPSNLYPGIKQAIKEIWEMGRLSKNPDFNTSLRLGINTNSSWEVVYNDLQKYNLLKYFDSFVTEETLHKFYGEGDFNAIRKPSNISLALAMGFLGSEGAFTLHVGDTLSDLIASKNIIRLNSGHPENLISVGVTWGYESAVEGKERARSVLEGGIEVSGQKRIYFDYVIDNPLELVEIVKKYMKE